MDSAWGCLSLSVVLNVVRLQFNSHGSKEPDQLMAGAPSLGSPQDPQAN